MKRLFIAIDADKATRDAIGRISADLREQMAAGARVSWVRPERVHLTLYFHPHADHVLEQRILAALADPVPEAAFNLSFHGLGVFPPRGSPRVLWLGIRDGLPELRRIQQILAERIRAGAGRPFSPHLTLARFRSRVSRAAIEEIAPIPASAGPCRIDRVTLYESRLSAAGPLHLRLAEATLTP